MPQERPQTLLSRRNLLIAAGTGAVGLAGAAAARAAGVDFGFTGRTEARLLRLPDNPVGVDAVDNTLQGSVVPRLKALLTNLGQLPYESDGVVRIPNSGISIVTTDNGRQVQISKQDVVDGNTRHTSISFLYQGDSRDKIWGVGTRTSLFQGDPPIHDEHGQLIEVSEEEKVLMIDGRLGKLYIAEKNSDQQFITEPTSAMPNQLTDRGIAEFKQTFVDVLNAIDTRETATKDKLKAKVTEWEAKILAHPDKKTLGPYNGITYTEIKVRIDEITSYGISLGIDSNGDFQTMTAIKMERDTPYVENEYTVDRKFNEEPLNMFRIRLEDGDGARGTFEHYGTTGPVNPTDPLISQALTQAQFELWSQDIDSIINAVAA